MDWFSKLPCFFLFFGRVYRLPLKLLSLLRNSFQGENTNISRNPIRWFWVPSIPAFIERLWFFRSERKDPGGPSVSIELNYYQQNQHKTHIFFEPGRKHGDEEQNRFELHKLPGERKRWFDLMSSFMDVSVFWWFRKITTYCNHWIWPSQFLHDITPDRKKNNRGNCDFKKNMTKIPRFITPLTWQFKVPNLRAKVRFLSIH